MRIIAGKYKGKKIISPIHKDTRPTSDRTREMIFNILLHNPALGPSVVLNKAVLDIFAGTGALGLEALSRGALSSLFIENNQKILPILRTNLKNFGLSPSSILEKNVQQLGKTPSSFDLVFLDPPYEQNLVSPTLDHLFSHGWLSSKAVLVIETKKDEIIPCPPFLSCLAERFSGLAKVIFYITK